MYKTNGIELTSREFDELKALAEHGVAGEHLPVSGGKFHTYLKLSSLGLIRGDLEVDCFIFSCVTQNGRDFVFDVQKLEANRKSSVMSDRKFQIGLSLATLILSGLISAGIALCLA